jgi:acetyl-CoA acetyltransferase
MPRAGRRRSRRPPPTLDALEALKPIHSTEGTITVGNSAFAADGAAVALIGGVRPRGRRKPVRVGGWALVGRTARGSAAALAVAVRRAATLLGTAVSDLTAIEVHEGSAAFCLAVARELELDPRRLNQRGGGIATGSPGAAAGPRMVERARAGLEAADGPAAAVVAMPAPGGEALALALDCPEDAPGCATGTR